MLGKLKDLIWQRIIKNTYLGIPHFTSLGYVLIISYLGFYIFNSLVAAPGGYENISLRILISFMGLFLILFKKGYFQQIKSLLPIIFHFILLFSFPFFFSFMMFKNQEVTVWQLKELVGLVLLSYFVDWISFIVLAILGIGLGYLGAFLSGEDIVINLLGIFGSYSAPLIYLLIFNSKKQELYDNLSHYSQKIEELNNQLENKVKERTVELELALAVKSEFLNNISHEVRTPIQGFTALSEGLSNFWDNLDEVKRKTIAKQIALNASRLATLVNNVLDLSKLVSKKEQMNITKIDFSSLIKEVADEAKDLFLFNKNINIHFNIFNKIYIEADKEMIVQVIRNLIVNAIKFSNDNGYIEISVSKYFLKGQRSIYFKIEDNGVGIPSDELESIFEPFVQSSRTKTAAVGTGLGLSISKKIIEAHQGKIWATNNKVKGADFHFILPEKQFLSSE